MSSKTRTAHGDIRGAARLAVDATAGLTDLVEAMHQRIASAPGATAADGRTRGITGLVYRSIRGVTRLVGGSVDGLLGLLEPLLAPQAAENASLPERPPQPQREAIVAALNGVLGDHLAATNNPLATTMALRQAGQPLVLDRATLQTRFPQANGRVIVLLHGLCMNDLQWLREGHDHGAALAAELGATPLYLHYNSGLSIPENGRQFASLMAQLLAAWPVPVDRLVLLAHSMGGLVARSALAQAQDAGQAWPRQVTELVCLGTPHFGAPLERAGHGLDVILENTPYAAPLARLGKVRSAGITDLRHGRVQPVAAGSPATHNPGAEATLPLPDFPAGPRCYAIAGCLGASSQSLKARLAGDGLVPVDSALGRHADAARALHFAPERQWVAQGVNHMALLSDSAVSAQLQAWLCPPAADAASA